jgi:hypothetical protein
MTGNPKSILEYEGPATRVEEPVPPTTWVGVVLMVLVGMVAILVFSVAAFVIMAWWFGS